MIRMLRRRSRAMRTDTAFPLFCLLLATRLALATGSDLRAQSATTVIGDPAAPARLPQALLDAYAQGARDITITPGTYVLPATGRNSIELRSWRDVSIHARGVTVVFQELAHRPLLLYQCERVTVEGATLRFVRPAFTQGRILAMGKDVQGTWLDWQIDAGYPADLDPAKSTLDVADQVTRLLRTGTGDIGCASYDTLEPGLFRLHRLNGAFAAAVVGDWLFTRHGGGGSTVVQLDGCNHCTMQALTLQNAGFAAFFETDGAGGNVYQDCKVMPGPRPDGATEAPLVGCGADGFHSAGATVGPTLDHCSWEGLLHDDCIAIHGSLQQVLRSEGNRLVLERGNRGHFAVGEPVRISSTNAYVGEFTCTAIRTLKEEAELLELTLDGASGAPANSKASNPCHNGAGFQILHCTLGNCRSRGILVKGDNGLIEDCTISGCGMSAISVGPEYYWNEADYSRNVTIRGNKLLNNVLNGSSAGVVFVHGDGATGNKDIVIDDNLFDQNYGQVAIHVEDTDGVRIDSNRFVTCPLDLPGRSRTILDFTSTRNISLRGNVVEGSATADALVELGRNVGRIDGNDASGIRRGFNAGSPRVLNEGHDGNSNRALVADFTFTITADSHLDERTDRALYRQTLSLAAADKPAFHIDLGDTFMTEKHESREAAAKQYRDQREFFNAFSVPVCLVTGNHDAESGRYLDGTTNNLAAWSRAMRLRYFPSPLADASRNYYSWERGNAMFVVLDPYWHTPRQRRNEDNWTRTLGAEQYRWLQKTLETSKAEFKFVFVHQLVGGLGQAGRGGVEAAPFFEWGGRNEDGTDGFKQHRPGWSQPIHQLLVAHHVTAVFHGHDHLYAKQDLDGIVYQEVPQPGDPRPNPRTAGEYGYGSGAILPGSGYMRVSISPRSAKLEYVRTDRSIAHSYEIPAMGEP
jgi:hypothetical protein